MTDYSLPTDFGTTEEGDEESIGNWAIGWHRECLVKERIACPEIGYTISEALYSSIEEWEQATKQKWDDVYQL